MAFEHQPPDDYDGPLYRSGLVFLAGPIQGAPDWQAEALGYFHKHQHVANPRHDYANEIFDKNRQVHWEKHHLRRAAENGGVLFWFAAQDLSLEYEPGRAYAQTSRIEFGRVIGWKDHRASVCVSLGIDPQYAGGNSDYIRDTAAEHHITVCYSLADTATALQRLIEQ